jgi:hypothetical protein
VKWIIQARYTKLKDNEQRNNLSLQSFFAQIQKEKKNFFRSYKKEEEGEKKKKKKIKSFH